MAYMDVKQNDASVMTAPVTPSEAGKPLSPLEQYKVLVGNIYAPPSETPGEESFYHEILAEERKAKVMYFFSGLLFFTCLAAQIVLCLGITIGAQMRLSNDQISILAGVNTGVAAIIAVLKGLGLPEKKAVERNALRKVAEKVRATTRKLMSGVEMNVVRAADEVMRMEEVAVESAHVNLAGVDVPAAGGEKR